MNLKKKFVNPVTFITLFFLLIFVVGNSRSNTIDSLEFPLGIETAGFGSNENWHTDSSQSTPEVDVTYTYQYKTSTDPSHEADLLQTMNINYKDGTGSSVGFQNVLQFNAGGLDVPSEQVLDWDKLRDIEPTLLTTTKVNGTDVQSRTKFNGFDIVTGDSQDLKLYQAYQDASNWYYTINDTILLGRIEFANRTTTIGDVILSTRDYTYDGQDLKESIANFNVTIDATIGNVNITAIVTVHIVHNMTYTDYKYGVVIDWSAYKDFPTNIPINTGDQFFLVAQDRLNVGPGTWQIGTFDINNANDTAIFNYQGTEYARQFFTTQYSINGTLPPQDTNRVYYALSAHSDLYGDFSRVFVCFDGFKYNQSTGLTFDPRVLLPISAISAAVSDSSIIGTPVFVLISVGAVVVVIIIKKFRRNLPD